MLSKIKNFFKRNAKPCVTALAVAIVSAMSCLTCFAAENDASLQSAFSTGIAGVKDEVLGYLALVVPVAIGIVIAYIAVKKGISFLRGLIGK